MVKRHADGAVVAACASSCLDVLPSYHIRAADQPILCSIENLPSAGINEASKLIANKKQCRLGADQGRNPADASVLFAQARAVLRQPFCPSEAPVGREQEFRTLTQAFEDFTSTGSGSSIYVSGLPGTGKSHTVRKSLSHLLTSSSGPKPQCLITWINCMSVSSAGEVYAQVAATARAGHSSDWQHSQHEQQDSNETTQLPFDEQQLPQQQSLSFESLLDCLQQQQQQHKPPAQLSASSTRGTKRCRATRASCSASTAATNPSGNPSSSSNGPQHTSLPPHIVVLDEIDNIAKKSLSDLVQLFKLPHQPGVSVLVVGIANSIDLTERALPELRLQLVTPRLVTFNAYTAQQLGAILDTIVQQMPCKLFHPAALQLCCRSVGASNGDLRHALKTCRAAVDELEQQHNQQQATAAALNDGCTLADGPASCVSASAALSAPPMVGPKQMSLALTRLAGVRSSQFGAQAASIIRSLPNQQQLLLYSLAVLCQQPADAAAGAGGQAPVTPSKGGKVAASSLWQGAGSAAVLSSSNAGCSSSPAGGSWSAGLKKKKKTVATGSSGQPGAHGSVFVLAVTADAAYIQYCKVCKLLKLPASSKGELLHMADLLAQMALLDTIKAPAATGLCSSASKGSKGSAASAGALRGFKASGSKLGGLGGSRGLLGGAGGRGGSGLGGSPMGSAGGAGQQGEVRLCLRASSSEVFAAVKHNPALRCLVDV